MKIGNYQQLLPGFFLLVISAIAVWPLWQGNFYAVGDMRDVTIPLEIFFHEQVGRGQLPSWHPDIAWGFPVIASAQIGFFYPPLLLLRLLPVWLYLPLIVFMHVGAVLLGMWLFLRREVSENAALFGSVTFGLSAFVWQHLSHLNIFLSVAWLPWQLLAAAWVAQTPRWRARQYAVMALCLALPFLAGQLQLPFLQALFVFVYILSHRRNTSLPKAAGRIVILGIVISLLAAAQIVPTLELLRESSRGLAGDFDTVRANQHSFPLYHLPTLIFPRFFGTDATYWGKRLEIEYGIFVGTLPLLLAAWFGWRMLRRQERTTRYFWLVTAAISFLLALGSLSPIRLLGIEPSLWFFSAPARWLLFTALSLSVFAAHGFEAAFKQRATVATFLQYALGGLGALVLAANAGLHYVGVLLPKSISILGQVFPYLLAGRDPGYYHEKLSSLIQSLHGSSVSWSSWYTYIPFAALILGILALRQKRPRLLLAVTAIELLLIAATTTPTVPWRQILATPATYYALPTAIQQKEVRIMSLQPDGDTGAWFTNPSSRPDTAAREQQRQLLLPLLSTQYGTAGIHWPASLDIQAQEQVLQELRGDGLELLNVRAASARTVGAVLMPKSLGVLSGTSQTTYVGDLVIYSLPAAPRAEVISSTAAKPNTSYTTISPTHTRVRATSDCDCPLVVRDTWFPGWLAFVDGQATPIERAEGIFRQVQLTPGTHTIDFYYRPYWQYAGGLISLLTLGGCLFLLRSNRDNRGGV